MVGKAYPGLRVCFPATTRSLFRSATNEVKLPTSVTDRHAEIKVIPTPSCWLVSVVSKLQIAIAVPSRQ